MPAVADVKLIQTLQINSVLNYPESNIKWAHSTRVKKEINYKSMQYCIQNY